MLVLKKTLIGLFFGTFGTTIGGIIGVVFKKNSNKFLSVILSFAAGLMMSVISFELIPESLKIGNIYIVILGILLGLFSLLFCENLVKKIFSYKIKKNNDMLKIGIIVAIGLAIHNLPEGLAIGSGFEASMKLGLGVGLAICLHDIPEGISMAIPMKNGGMSPLKVVLYVFLSGITTGVGAFLGVLIGDISINIISICLSFAAGAMLYIVSGELVPEANKLFSGKMSILGNICGFLVGFFVSQI